MKFPQDTIQNKITSTLLPTLTNQAGEGLAIQSKRGFAENLRHQISVVAQASGHVVKAGKPDISRQPDIRPETNQRGSDLPAREQKLPRDRGDNHDRQASTGKESVLTVNKSQSQSREREDTADLRSNTASPDNSRPSTVLGKRPAISADQANSGPDSQPGSEVALPVSDSKTSALSSASGEQLREEAAPEGPLDPLAEPATMSLPVAGKTPAVFKAAFIQQNTSGQSADPLVGDLLASSVAASTEIDSGVSDTVPAALFALNADDLLSASSATFLSRVSASPSIFAARPLTAASLFADMAETADAPPFLFRSASSTLAAAVELAQTGLQHTGMPALARQNQLLPQPGILPGAQTQASQQAMPSESAVATDLFERLMQTDVSVDATEGGEISFSEKLQNQKPALPSSVQYASLLSQSGQQAAAPADAALTSGLLQGLISGQLASAAGPETASLSGLSAGAGTPSGSTASPTSSGFPAAQYSQEQRQQAAVEARNAQAQNSRALDTSLSTTSALKLPGLDVTFGQAGWVDRIGRQMLLQSAQGSSSAQIRLDPPELGSLTVKIQLVDQSAAVNFVSPHAMVRDALEQQAGRLQEMFKEQGMDLLDVSVSDQSPHPDGGDQRNSNGTGSGSSTWIADDGAVSAPVVRQSVSLIDFYA